MRCIPDFRGPLVRRLARATGTALIAMLVATGVAPVAAQAVPLEQQRAEAARLDAEVNDLEVQYDSLQERHRGARIRLSERRETVVEARADLRDARRRLRRAQRRLAERASAIYRSGSSSSSIASIIRGGTIADMFDRIDAVERVGEQDADVLEAVGELTERVQKQEVAVSEALDRQRAVTRETERAAGRMSSVLGDRQAALDAANAEVRAIMEAQRRAEAERRAREARAAEQVRAAAAAADAAAADAAAAAEAADDEPEPIDDGSDDADADGGGAPSSDAAPSRSGFSRPTSSAPAAPSGGGNAGAAQAAMTRLGMPYVWAASGPTSFDCSGLVIWAYAQAGRPGLPHSSYALADMGTNVPLSQLAPGDLVFSSSEGHMGMYVGGGSFVHAPRSGDVVKVSSMSDYPIAHARRI